VARRFNAPSEQFIPSNSEAITNGEKKDNHLRLLHLRPLGLPLLGEPLAIGTKQLHRHKIEQTQARPSNTQSHYKTLHERQRKGEGRKTSQ
jgi:hypothetical protein